MSKESDEIVKELERLQRTIEEREYKKVMLDFSEINPNDPKSVRRYGKRCELAGEMYYGIRRAEKEVERLKKEVKRLEE